MQDKVTALTEWPLPMLASQMEGVVGRLGDEAKGLPSRFAICILKRRSVQDGKVHDSKCWALVEESCAETKEEGKNDKKKKTTLVLPGGDFEGSEGRNFHVGQPGSPETVRRPKVVDAKVLFAKPHLPRRLVLPGISALLLALARINRRALDRLRCTRSDPRLERDSLTWVGGRREGTSG
ncbi:hypothetical protein GGTG_04896 [Gaeumannomyces tritici R3-111a-1]|uniref:Uncharacterized protein n=1 Tax=Gaeumannomyces tritici (strain R3-111a-1) TaxID=644352 RepID=J3NUE0_GAET3|nr:hypothetical protein GGTG_04896 [Gaeumannomyces tritici R3-111a-1]EJT79813.1 hypothetical protein GGTG_04896 [Gaeumannomyces tritici R3-111a-1]